MQKRFYTKGDTVSVQSHESLQGRVIVIDPEALEEEYQKPSYQLWRCLRTEQHEDGTISVHASCLADGDTAIWEEAEVLGTLKLTLVKEACRLIGIQIDPFIYQEADRCGGTLTNEDPKQKECVIH